MRLAILLIFDHPLSCTVGHSLGGALATLASLDLAVNMHPIISTITKEINRKLSARATASISPTGTSLSPQFIKEPLVTVYTFGTPRIGNEVFAALVNHCLVPSKSLHNSNHTNNYRVVMDGDIIPMIPKQLLCRQMSMGLGNWKHCGTPILLSAVEDKETTEEVANETKTSAGNGEIRHDRDMMEARSATMQGNIVINPSVLEIRLFRNFRTGEFIVSHILLSLLQNERLLLPIIELVIL